AASPNSRTITPQQLRDGATRLDPPGGPPPYGHGGHIYWLGWPRKFNHVLVMHFGADIGPLPPRLREIAAVPIATLYRVTSK
ncbi:MAG TPA: hypothetical protein VMB71_05130, partial [Acetobacteraceae bacterium]|nr:hypothetical protein [Acetobacteraceae bacterium]